MCSSLSTSTSTADNRITLIDSRDNKEYKVSKLADGNCWMVSNLALDGNKVLTTADSDVTANRTLVANITSGTSVDYATQIISSIANNSGCSNVNVYCITTNIEKYGNLYNWYAATATTGTSSMTNSDAPDSVCPKNWKLPTSGTPSAYGASAPDKSYGKLIYSVLGYTSEYTVGASGGPYVQKVQQAPLWSPLPGFYLSGLGYQGRDEGYWSRKAHSNSSNAYDMYIDAGNGNFTPQEGALKTLGFSVRCVFNGS